MRRPQASSRALQAISGTSEGENNDDEDDDEETLQLKLQAIEAKLRLKKLQQARKGSAPADSGHESPKRKSTVGESSPRKRLRLDDDVQIPVSPSKERESRPQNTSPAKVLLGIDKGWTAHDVSLKRPRTGMPGPAIHSHHQRKEEPLNKGKSFSERLAENRLSEQERQAKQDRIEQARSKSSGFSSLQSGSKRQESTPARSCLLYTSPSPRDGLLSRMPSSA